MTRVKIARRGEENLVASGQMRVPRKAFDEEHFWSIGARLKNPKLRTAIRRAVEAERNEDNGKI
jgi:hypothetical protein